jgi:hypothetical protein
LLRFIKTVKVAELKPDSEAFCRCQVAVKIAIGFLRLLEVAENTDRAIEHP